MVARWREGYDVVYGVRAKRHGETWFKKVTAALFYRFLRAMLGVNIPVDAGDFRLMSRPVVLTLRALREQHRFVRGMVAWVGFRQTAVTYERPAPLRRRDQVPAPQDAALRHRRHHVVLDRPAAHSRPGWACWSGFAAIGGGAWAFYVKLFGQRRRAGLDDA